MRHLASSEHTQTRWYQFKYS